jgi:pimeloyl-ACP methyl ester carboxylesterase
MIHGAFSGGWVFEEFGERFRAAGHRVATPDLPGHRPGDPPSAVVGLSMRDYADAMVREARNLERPPIIVGHSLGGLVALLTAARVKTAGLVLLAPSPPWGIAGATLEEAISAVALYALGPYWAQAIQPEFNAFSRFNVDRLPKAERRAVFERMGAESGRALFETLNWWLDPFMTTLAQPARIGAPILAVVGEKDVIHPPGTVGETARRLGAQFKVLPNMSHWLPAEPGWREVADLSLAWLEQAEAEAAA